ncbi:MULTISPECIES: hypothetical protein [unclassified Amycolatopsis]|uniref:hypothetical protein n=1 Tax=unclassified Amycolatopsis TaxID=2618356 RepID=UPI001FF1D796|nr:hypothetical protein [Amycolatopsis sp. FBCC-B4732]UOX89461.1 hypothetical protein MUY14_02125 [Amycolatopsis sp. FBCC-B4732]
MSAQVSADVRALFADMGIEFEKAATDLAIDRFEQWSNRGADLRPVMGTICNMDLLEAA